VNAAVRLSTTVDFTKEYAAAAERLAVAVARSDPRAPVPGCPGWSVLDLVVHVGNVHAWAASIVETGRAAAEQNDRPSSSRPRVVSSWYAGKAEDLYEVLRGADPAAPCWNFAFGSGTKRFWSRRQLHETTVHQVDLDLVLHKDSEIRPAVAGDGVDEVLGVFLHRMHQRGHAVTLDRPLALVASDTGDAWVVSPRTRPDATAPVPAQARSTGSEALPPTVAHRRTSHAAAVEDRVEGPAEVLYRLLWGRVDVDAADVRLSGDEQRVRRFLASRLVP
jgi:uncharacterized protein (TIGR03083 family)